MDIQKLGFGFFLVVFAFAAVSCSSESAAKRKQKEACEQTAMAEAGGEAETALMIQEQCESGQR